MPRNRLESMTGELPRGKVVAPDGVQRVDQLAAREHEPHALRSFVERRYATAGGAAAKPRWPDARKIEGNTELHRAAIEERQVESVQVVILDDVRICRANDVAQLANQF